MPATLTLATDDRGRLTVGDASADRDLPQVVRNAKRLAADMNLMFYVWVGANGLSVHWRRPLRPYLECRPDGGTTFRAAVATRPESSTRW